MAWPSQRVSQGGIFHPAKVDCSTEARKFISELIQESKMQIKQRQQDYILRNGKPLPPLHTYTGNPYNLKPRPPKVTISLGSSKRRSQSTIVNSDAFRVERYIPRQAAVDREKAKQHLQDVMAYGKEANASANNKSKAKPKEKAEDLPEENRFDQLVKEIDERQKWLNQMADLGADQQYKIIIEQQIQTKLRELEKLKTYDSDTKASYNK